METLLLRQSTSVLFLKARFSGKPVLFRGVSLQQ
jgi:hypothetical protein